MGRYKFNNRGTGTIFFFFFIQWRIQGGGQGWSPPPPVELVPILKTYCKVFVTGTDRPPPLGMWMASHRQCPTGGGGACECPRVGVFFNFSEGGWRHAANVQGVVLVNVQEWGCFSIFRRADDVTQTMSRGGACGMSSPTPPPSGNPVSAPVICVKFRANQPLCPPPPTKAFPYAYDPDTSAYFETLLWRRG